MDFTFSADQDALRASVHDLLDDLAGRGRIRTMIDGDDSAIDEMWQSFGELGWPSLLVPESAGGLGLGLVDAVVVLEEMGRVTLPGPFLSSSVCATTAAVALGLDELLPDLAAGTTTGTLALEELGHDDPVERVRTRATRTGGRWVLDGLKPMVFDGAAADWVIVAARTQEGMGSFLVERPEMTPVEAMDPTRRVARLDLEATAAARAGPAGDMLHHTEMARVGVHFAAWSADVDDEHRSRSAAIAKAAAGEAAVSVTGENIQVHGAVGFTWDADPHLLYKRAKQNDVLGGSQSWHRRRVAAALLSPTP